MKAEQRYCIEQITNLKNAILEMEKYQDESVLNEYKDVVYIERRADNNIFIIFKENEMISNCLAFLLH